MKLFFDTNVWIDFFLNRDDCAEMMIDLFSLCRQRKHEIVMTPMTMRDLGYVIQRYTHDWKKTRQYQNQAFALVTSIIPNASDDAIESLYTDWKDYEDALQNEAAERAICNAIITSDIRDFERSRLPLFTPKSFLEYLYQNA